MLSILGYVILLWNIAGFCEEKQQTQIVSIVFKTARENPKGPKWSKNRFNEKIRLRFFHFNNSVCNDMLQSVAIVTIAL